MADTVAKCADAEKKSAILQLRDYCLTNPIAVITSAGSFMGGLLILTYLASIQYFPSDISVSTVGFLLAGAAIIGTVLTIMLAIYLVVPGALYQHIFSEQACQSQDQSSQRRLNLLSGSSVFWMLDTPSFISFVLIIVLVFFEFNGIQPYYLMAAALPMVILLLYGKFLDKEKRIWSQIAVMYDEVKLLKWDALYFFLPAFTAFLPWFCILLLVSQYEIDAVNEEVVWLMFLGLYIAAIFVNHLIAGAKRWWFLAVAALTLLFMFLAITQQFSFIPKMVMRALAFGNIPRVTLLLDEQGCQIASQYVLPSNSIDSTVAHASPATSKKMDQGKESKNEAIACRLLPVNLRWRIGNEYFVDATGAQLYLLGESIIAVDNGKKAKKQSQSQKERVTVNGEVTRAHLQPLLTSGFSISSAHVLSWSLAEQKKTVAP